MQTFNYILILIVGIAVGVGIASMYLHGKLEDMKWLHINQMQALEAKHEVRMQEYMESLLTKRERELHDAGRTTLPRDDAGPPAVVKPGLTHRRPRNA